MVADIPMGFLGLYPLARVLLVFSSTVNSPNMLIGFLELCLLAQVLLLILQNSIGFLGLCLLARVLWVFSSIAGSPKFGGLFKIFSAFPRITGSPGCDLFSSIDNYLEYY